MSLKELSSKMLFYNNHYQLLLAARKRNTSVVKLSRNAQNKIMKTAKSFEMSSDEVVLKSLQEFENQRDLDKNFPPEIRQTLMNFGEALLPKQARRNIFTGKKPVSRKSKK